MLHTQERRSAAGPALDDPWRRVMPTIARPAEPATVVGFACHHRRVAAILAERHLRAVGWWGDWQRSAFLTGRCPECVQAAA